MEDGLQLALGDRRLDLDTREGHGPNGSFRLTPTEAAVLRYLAERANTPVSQEALLRDVWGYNTRVRSRTVVTTIHRIRQKLEPDPQAPRNLIRTRHGYRLVLSAPAAEPCEPRRELPSFQTPWISSPALDPSRFDEPGIHVLWGPVGSGKTRLACEIASRAPDSTVVTYVDLAACRSESDVFDVLASEAGQGPSTGRPEFLESLSQQGPAVLILDHGEACLAAVSQVCDALADHNPACRILVPTRTRPESSATLHRVDALEPALARQLLERCAERHHPEWSRGTHPDVLDQIVAAVDRLPLGIEVAASLASTLSPDELRSLVDREFDPLGIEVRGVGAVLDHAWQECSEEDRSMALRVAAMWGPCSLESLVADPRELAALRALVDRSLVLARRPPSSGRTTYDMLRVVRRFARSRISTGQLAELQVRGAQSLARAARDAITRNQIQSIGVLDLDRPNLRSAASVLEEAEARGWLLLACALLRFPTATVDALHRAGEAKVSRELAFHLSIQRFRAMQNSDRASSGEALQRAAELADTDRDRAFVEVVRLSWLPRPPASELDAAVERTRGMPGLQPLALTTRAYNAVARHDLASASDDFAESARLSRSEGYPLNAVTAENGLATCLAWTGRYDDAIRMVEESVATCTRFGWPHMEAKGNRLLANLLASTSRMAEAADAGTRAFRSFCRQGQTVHAGTVAPELGLVLTDLGRHDEARARFEWALERMTRLGFRDTRPEHPRIGLARLAFARGDLEDLRRTLANATWHTDWGRGASALWLGIADAIEAQALEPTCDRLSDAVDLLDRSRNPAWAHTARVFHAAVLELAGRLDAADQTLAAAASYFDRSRAPYGRELLETLAEQQSGRTTPAGRRTESVALVRIWSSRRPSR